MRKYYVIRLAYDDGFWNEEKQDFVGWLNATKYLGFCIDPITHKIATKYENELVQLKLASSKKPVTICEIYESE